jgi:hypothetical protein
MAISMANSGCTSLANFDYSATNMNQVAPVMTEYSLGLTCLGELIDQTNKPPLTIYVDDIKDQTIPDRFEERRLSHGARWWIYTAISKIGSKRIHTTMHNFRKSDSNSNHFVFSGAWTQDDVDVKTIGGGAKAQLGDFYFGIGSSRTFDVIAGDFVSTVNDKVLYASAISVAVGHDGTKALLKIEDRDNSFALDVTNTMNEGPQFAQRRIAEAALMIHLARYFGINPQPCIEAGLTRPRLFRKRLDEYNSFAPGAKIKALQRALKQAGYNPGSIDGRWAGRSSRALMRFQADKGLPVNGRRSGLAYAMLSLHKPQRSKSER